MTPSENANCRKVLPLLVAHIENALTPDARATVDAHLSRCASCRGERDALAQTLSDISAFREESVPSEVSIQRLRREARSQSPATARIVPFPVFTIRRAAAAAAIVLAVLVTKTVYVHHETPRHSAGTFTSAGIPRQKSSADVVSVQPRAEAGVSAEAGMSPRKLNAPARLAKAPRYKPFRRARARNISRKGNCCGGSTDDQIRMAAIKTGVEHIETKLAEVRLTISEEKTASVAAADGWAGVDSNIEDLKSDFDEIESKVEQM